jgi:rhamnosyl/mannosyltransferase
MKVVHVYKDYAPVVGGIENHVRLLAESQAAQGLDVTVLVTNLQGGTTVSRERGVRVIRAARLATLASTPLSLALLRQLRGIEADIAHLHFPYPLGEVAQLLMGRSRRLVISYHSDIVRQKTLLRAYRPVMERLLARADRILVATPQYLASSPTLASLKNKCVVLPYGIDQRPFQALHGANPTVRALRERYGPGPILLFVGVLRYYKGLSYLLDAMRQIEARLVIVGLGPMYGPLREQVAALGIADKVSFAGAVADADLPAIYRAADLFVLPACERSEAFGLVLVEALASGLPLVTTELGTGTSYVNRDGETGLVVAPRDSQALARVIGALLADRALRARLAQGAVAWAPHFRAEGMVSDIITLYSELLG